MFDCGTPEDFRCGFDASSMFQSGALYINRHAFEKSRYSHQENHRSELSRLNEVLGAGLGEEDEDELLNDGIQSARSMMQDTQPMSRYSSRRGGYDMAGNQVNSFSNSLRDNEEQKFTGKSIFVDIHPGFFINRIDCIICYFIFYDKIFLTQWIITMAFNIGNDTKP